MIAMQESIDINVDDWLADRVSPTVKTLVTDHPWAQTWRVSAADQTYYLKVLPESQRAGLIAAAELGRRFAGTVPQTVAVDADRGFLLLCEHGGRNLDHRAGQSDRLGVLRTYARLQAKCVSDTSLLLTLPEADLGNLTAEFLHWIATDADDSHSAGAAHFLGQERAAFYAQRLKVCAALLENAVQQSRHLPLTINHCDLRMQNTAVGKDGGYVLFDWDEVVAGPAGMSLHNFFSGCSAVIRLLDPIAGQEDERCELLEAYIAALASAGYASDASIRACLPGAMCAGVMRYLMSYGKFPLADAEDREQVSQILVRRLDDLLAFCDLRAVPERATVVQLVDDCEEADSAERARDLLAHYLKTSPGDLELRARLGFVHRYLGDSDAAEQLCRQSLELAPTHAEFRHLLGQALLDRLAIDDAVEQLRLAVAFAPDDVAIRHSLDSAAMLQEFERHAARPGCVPTIRFSEEERAAGSMSRAKRRLAGRLFRDYGVLLVEGIYQPGLMDRLAGAFEDEYRAYLADDRPDDALKVGNRRFMITVDVANDFNTPDLFAPPLLVPILSRLLGDDFILGSFTAVTSLPGAADMRMHKDHPSLFSHDELPGPQPTVAVTTLIPLKGFDLSMGTTRVVKGSHRRSSDDAARMEWQDPCAPKGSCLLMDYRLSHQGLANRSVFVRPVLSLVYNRPWFRDSVNYERQEPLRIARADFNQVPEAWRRLFAWTRP